MPGFGREPCHYSTVSSQTTAVPVGGEQLPQGWSKFSSCSRLASRLFAIWNGHRTLLRPNSCAPPSHRCLLRILPANFRLRFRPSRDEPVATGRVELLREPAFRRRLADLWTQNAPRCSASSCFSSRWRLTPSRRGKGQPALRALVRTVSFDLFSASAAMRGDAPSTTSLSKSLSSSGLQRRLLKRGVLRLSAWMIAMRANQKDPT